MAAQQRTAHVSTTKHNTACVSTACMRAWCSPIHRWQAGSPAVADAACRRRESIMSAGCLLSTAHGCCWVPHAAAVAAAAATARTTWGSVFTYGLLLGMPVSTPRSCSSLRQRCCCFSTSFSSVLASALRVGDSGCVQQRLLNPYRHNNKLAAA